MQTTQLLLDFSAFAVFKTRPVVSSSTWLDVTDLAKGAGFHCACEVSQELSDQLSDQALYDALCTARLTLSLDLSGLALFTLDMDGKLVRFKAQQTNHTVRLGRVADF